MNKILNPNIHDHLVAEGFEYVYFASTLSDEGDVENGPYLTGEPAFGVYESPSEYLVVDENGFVVHREDRDLELEAYEAKWGNPDPNIQIHPRSERTNTEAESKAFWEELDRRIEEKRNGN